MLHGLVISAAPWGREPPIGGRRRDARRRRFTARTSRESPCTQVLHTIADITDTVGQSHDKNQSPAASPLPLHSLPSLLAAFPSTFRLLHSDSPKFFQGRSRPQDRRWTHDRNDRKECSHVLTRSRIDLARLDPSVHPSIHPASSSSSSRVTRMGQGQARSRPTRRTDRRTTYLEFHSRARTHTRAWGGRVETLTRNTKRRSHVGSWRGYTENVYAMSTYRSSSGPTTVPSSLLPLSLSVGLTIPVRTTNRKWIFFPLSPRGREGGLPLHRSGRSAFPEEPVNFLRFRGGGLRGNGTRRDARPRARRRARKVQAVTESIPCR